MAGVDTNVLLRIALQDDIHQSRAAALFLKREGPCYVTHLVLAELVWVLEGGRKESKKTIVTALERVLDNEAFAVQAPGIVKDALDVFRRSNADFSDCLILAQCKHDGQVPLATFDRALGKLDGAKLLK